MTEPKNHEEPHKKKRKRNTVVCLPCRKRKIKCDRKKPCTQCVYSNASNFCFYSSPQWALDAFMSNQQNLDLNTKGALKALGQNEQAVDIDARRDSSRTASIASGCDAGVIGENIDILKETFNHMSQLTKTDSKSDGSISPYLNELYRQLDDIKFKIEEYTNKTKENTSDELNLNISIDFFKHFKTLEIKRSSDISCKPLSTSSLIRKDQYLQLVFQYYNARTIIRKLNKNCFPGSRKQTRGAESNIAHSVLDLIKINEDKIPLPNSILDKKRKDAGILRIINTSLTASNEKGEFKNQQEQEESETAKEAVKDEILNVLKEIPVVYLKKYMVSFWDFVYPTLPILDRSEFEETLTRILGGLDIMSIDENDPNQQDTTITKVEITLTFDLIHLAMFLVMLRFSYLVIIAQLKMHTVDRILLKKLKIPSTFFSLGNKCLGFYKPFKKSKLILLQYFILVKNYSLFSVEDGEGNDINQGTVLENICAILIKMIGLNRDPVKNQEIHEFCFQEKSEIHMYTIRKLFWVAVTMDHKTSSLTGFLSNFSTDFIKSYTDTLFPTALDVNLPKSKYDHNIEVGICEYLKSSVKVSILFNKIIEGTSRLHNHMSLKELVKDLNELTSALKANNCELNNMKTFDITNFTKDIEEVDYKDIDPEVLKLSLENFKIIELNFLTLNLKVSTLHAILIFLEDKNVMADDPVNKQVVTRMIAEMLIENLVELSDISHMYLNNEFKHYILKLDFHLNRLVQLAVEKTCLVMASLALKTSFAYSDNNNKEAMKTRESVFYYCLLIMNEMGSLLFNSCGIKYYQGYKSLITLRFVFKLLNYYPFESTSTAMIQFFMNFYTLLQQKTDSSDLETQKKIAMLFEKNCYQRGIQLPKQMVDFMTNWKSLNVGSKAAFEHTKFSNCFNDFELVENMLNRLKNSKSVRNQIFKFSYRSSGKLFKNSELEAHDKGKNSSFSEMRNVPNDDIGKMENKQTNLPNFTIITEHCARNILNEPTNNNNNPVFELNSAVNTSGNFPDIMQFLDEPYGQRTHDINNLNSQQQIPSLLGDEKIVKYLVPGFEAKMQQIKKSTNNEGPSFEKDEMRLNFDENNGEIDAFNDAFFNYGLDVLLGENEMFPQEDNLFTP